MSFDIYQTITDKIINKMEQGNFSWSKPWKNGCFGAFNRVSKKEYSMLNNMMLEHSGEYATFKQWSDLGGKIKKGSKAEMVVFWTFIESKTEKNEDGTPKQIPFLRYYNVFHISQVEGVEPLDKEEKTIERLEKPENIIKNYLEREKINYIEHGNKACYSPVSDSIQTPPVRSFETIHDYYSTMFHEMIHSTGHEKRLNRDIKNHFGTQDYSKEELIAEIGSSFICNLLNIENENTFKNSVAYLQSWIKVLKNDKKFIVSASSKAEKSVKFIIE